MFEPDTMATVLYAVIDPDHNSLTISNAGHLPPILTRPGQPNTVMDVPADVPVGAFNCPTPPPNQTAAGRRRRDLLLHRRSRRAPRPADHRCCRFWSVMTSSPRSTSRPIAKKAIVSAQKWHWVGGSAPKTGSKARRKDLKRRIEEEPCTASSGFNSPSEGWGAFCWASSEFSDFCADFARRREGRDQAISAQS